MSELFLKWWTSSIQSAKTRPGNDCGSDHELLIANFRLKLKKLGETTKTFSESESPSVMSDSLWPHGLQPVRLLCPWNSSCQNTGGYSGVGSCSILQGIFLTQGLNPGLLHCRWILYQLSQQGSSRTLEWETYPFSRGSSQPRHRTQISLIAGRFFTSWANREAQEYWNA